MKLFEWVKSWFVEQVEQEQAGRRRAPLVGVKELATILLAADLAQYGVDEHYAGIWVRLSRREQQALALMCQGLTDRQAAVLLSLRPDTVKDYILSARKKFGAASRSDLRASLIENGFAPYLRDLADEISARKKDSQEFLSR